MLDPVEGALALALEAAAKAGDLNAVMAITRELATRRQQREAPDVPTLDAERAKRTRR